MFRCSHGILNSFFAPWPAQNASWGKSRKRCFKLSPCTAKSFSAMFQVLAFHFELYFYLLTSSKCDLDEVNKAMIQFLASYFELIFNLLIGPKCDLRNVEKAIYQGRWILNFDISLLTLTFDIWPLTFDILTLNSISDWPTGLENDVSCCRQALRTHFLQLFHFFFIPCLTPSIPIWSISFLFVLSS